jgi:hypothetical protein
MAKVDQVVADEAIKNAAEPNSGWFQTSMNITVKCDYKDLKLRFNSHLIKGGFVSQAPNQGTGYTDEINVKYDSNILRRGFKGVLICQVQQSEQEFPYDTFIVIVWKAPLTGPARIYTTLVETGYSNSTWDEKSMKDLYKSFRSQFKPYTKLIEESWSLGNNTNIKLITNLGGDEDYYLKITIHEDRPSSRNYLPVLVAPKR